MAQSTPPAKSPVTLTIVAVLLVIGVVGALWVPLYARTTPMLGDFPFFYWYLLMWVPVVAILAFISYLLTRPKPAPGADASPGTSSAGGAEL
jgi:hypothetical protein